MFFEQLERLCKERGTTPTTVTKELGFSTGSMSQWKKGSSPTATVVQRFAEYFGVSMDSLMGRKDLIDIHMTGIRVWANSHFFTNDESLRIEDHLSDLLSRYKQVVNHACDARMGMGETVDLQKIREATEYDINDLIAWLTNLPDYFFGEYPIEKKYKSDLKPYISAEAKHISHLYDHASDEDKQIVRLTLSKYKDNVSIDYLLGRTDNPEVNKQEVSAYDAAKRTPAKASN